MLHLIYHAVFETLFFICFGSSSMFIEWYCIKKGLDGVNWQLTNDQNFNWQLTFVAEFYWKLTKDLIALNILEHPL